MFDKRDLRAFTISLFLALLGFLTLLSPLAVSAEQNQPQTIMPPAGPGVVA